MVRFVCDGYPFAPESGGGMTQDELARRCALTFLGMAAILCILAVFT